MHSNVPEAIPNWLPSPWSTASSCSSSSLSSSSGFSSWPSPGSFSSPSPASFASPSAYSSVPPRMMLRRNCCCRCCLLENPRIVYNIFENAYLRAALLRCVPSNLNFAPGDELPDVICADCWTIVQMAEHFRRRCSESDKVLRLRLRQREMRHTDSNRALEEALATNLSVFDQADVNLDTALGVQQPIGSVPQATRTEKVTRTLASTTSATILGSKSDVIAENTSASAGDDADADSVSAQKENLLDRALLQTFELESSMEITATLNNFLSEETIPITAYPADSIYATHDPIAIDRDAAADGPCTIGDPLAVTNKPGDELIDNIVLTATAAPATMSSSSSSSPPPPPMATALPGTRVRGVPHFEEPMEISSAQQHTAPGSMPPSTRTSVKFNTVNRSDNLTTHTLGDTAVHKKVCHSTMPLSNGAEIVSPQIQDHSPINRPRPVVDTRKRRKSTILGNSTFPGIKIPASHVPPALTNQNLIIDNVVLNSTDTVAAPPSARGAPLQRSQSPLPQAPTTQLLVPSTDCVPIQPGSSHTGCPCGGQPAYNHQPRPHPIRPFSCRFCGKAFKRSNKLRRHLVRRHSWTLGSSRRGSTRCRDLCSDYSCNGECGVDPEVIVITDEDSSTDEEQPTVTTIRPSGSRPLRTVRLRKMQLQASAKKRGKGPTKRLPDLQWAS